MRKRKRSRFVTRGDLATLALGRMLYAAGLRQRTPTDDLIVSLTSFPPRIGKLHLVIQALLQQSLQPRKIVLYLSLEEFPDRHVPTQLGRLRGDQFEIRYVSENLKSYKKLLFALEEFPERWIATFDDDRLYHRHCLAQLWDAAKAHPRTVVCAVARRLVVKDGQFLPYLEWRKVRSGAASFWLFPVGTYGILYPPGSLDPLVGNRTLFHDLAPDQDDIWFKAMSLKQNTPCLAVGGDGLMPLLEFENKTRLWTVNKVGNDVAWRRVLGHFAMTPATIAAQEMQLNAGDDTSRPA
jgi:hypothetical protein